MNADEQPYEDALEAVLLDRAGVIVAANRAWLEFSRANGGDPSRTGIGVSYLAACDAAAPDPVARKVGGAVRAAVRGDLPAPVTIRIPCHAPDAERWFDVLVSSRVDDWGDCVGASVTLLPAASPPPPPAAVLDPAGAAHAAAFDLLPDAGFALDATLHVTCANPAAAELLGYPEGELVGLTLAALDPDSALLSAPAASAPAGSTRPGGTRPSRLVTCALRRRDGSRVRVEAHVCCSDASGNGTSGAMGGAGRREPALTSMSAGPVFTVVARDLRGRRPRADPTDPADRTRPAGDLEPYRVAFEQAPIGMAMIQIDERGGRTLLRVNQALADLLGEPVDRLVGRDLAEYSTVDNLAHDRRAVADLFSGARRSYARHKSYRRADGRRVWTEVRVCRVDVPGSAVATTLAHFVDVTDRHEAARRRARQAETDSAVAEITTSVLAGTPLREVYQLVVDVTARVFEADAVTLALPDARTGAFVTVASVRPASVGPAAGEPTAGEPAAGEELQVLGPRAATRFGGGSEGGQLVVARAPGAEPFGEADLTVLTRLAQQIGLAVELGRARADQQRLAVLEDRQRIARDLHDTVIQDLIAVGMQLDAGHQRPTDAQTPEDLRRARRDTALVDQLEEAVRRLRGSVFDLRQPRLDRSLDDAVRAAAGEAARVLGHHPEVRITGQADTVPPIVGDAVVAVLREGLSNVARHAGARTTVVDLTVQPRRLQLVVSDDGRGLPGVLVPGDGIANVRQRASALDGTASVERRPDGGTRLVWSCPLPRTR